MRPALYNAKHKIAKINSCASKHKQKYHVVGPVCESTDIFGKNICLPLLCRGDKIAIFSTGAYGEVLANTYNSRNMIKAHLI